jgi:diacylglycerol kinase family enzyme
VDGYTLDLPDKDPDALWVLGGDGTVRIVVNALLAANRLQTPVGVVPMGTANVLAREFGLMRNDLEPLWAATESRRVRNLDIGSCNGTPFLMSAGFGFDAEAVARVNPARKRGTGRVEYAAACLSALMAYHRLPRWRVASCPHAEPRRRSPAAAGDRGMPGVEADAGWILVANSSRYAGGFTISDGTFFDGAFEVFLFPTRSAITLGGTLARGFIGLGWPVAARLHRGETLSIEGDGAAQLDGDEWRPGQAAITIRLLDQTVPVLVGQ